MVGGKRVHSGSPRTPGLGNRGSLGGLNKVESTGGEGRDSYLDAPVVPAQDLT